jgi:hypothetical protein
MNQNINGFSNKSPLRIFFYIVSSLIIGINIIVSLIALGRFILVPVAILFAVGIIVGIIFYYQYVGAKNKELIKKIINDLFNFFVFLASAGTIIVAMLIFYYYKDPYSGTLIVFLAFPLLIGLIFLSLLLKIIINNVDKNSK